MLAAKLHLRQMISVNSSKIWQDVALGRKDVLLNLYSGEHALTYYKEICNTAHLTKII